MTRPLIPSSLDPRGSTESEPVSDKLEGIHITIGGPLLKAPAINKQSLNAPLPRASANIGPFPPENPGSQSQSISDSVDEILRDRTEGLRECVKFLSRDFIYNS